MSSSPTNPRRGTRTARAYLTTDVLTAARQRTAWLYREFPTIIVNYSGGKDSTVALALAIEAATAAGRLPVHALFVDQETEWASTIDLMRATAADPRVHLHWLQAPLNLTNTAAGAFTAWDPIAEPHWVRAKEPGSIHAHPTGQRKYTLAFHDYVRATWPNQPTAQISGTRAEESIARLFGLTTHPAYKGETWAGRWAKRGPRYTFYPLYDWAPSDIWKAITDLNLPYNRLYDAQHHAGIPLRQMRAGNIHQESSTHHLTYLPSVEPDTWEALTTRLPALTTAAHAPDAYHAPTEPPPMFDGWRDYRDHLLEHLIDDPTTRETMRRTFDAHDGRYTPEAERDLMRTEVGMILTGDTTGQRLNAFHARRANARTTRPDREREAGPEPQTRKGPDS